MCAWGYNVGSEKIKFETNNEVVSILPKKPRLFTRIINWFKKIFGIK